MSFTSIVIEKRDVQCCILIIIKLFMFYSHSYSILSKCDYFVNTIFAEKYICLF